MMTDKQAVQKLIQEKKGETPKGDTLQAMTVVFGDVAVGDTDPIDLEMQITDLCANPKDIVIRAGCFSKLVTCLLICVYQGKDKTVAPVPVDDGEAVPLYTSKEMIPANLKKNKMEQRDIIDIIRMCKRIGAAQIVINPAASGAAGSAVFSLPQVIDFVKMFYDYQRWMDEKADKGMTEDDVFPIAIMNLAGRRVRCDLADGRHLDGDVRITKELPPTGPDGYPTDLKISINDASGRVFFNISEIKFIRDMSFWDQEDTYSGV